MITTTAVMELGRFSKLTHESSLAQPNPLRMTVIKCKRRATKLLKPAMIPAGFRSITAKNLRLKNEPFPELMPGGDTRKEKERGL